MPTAKAHASAIIAEYERALTELFGKIVILTNGIAGTAENLWLDEFHGREFPLEATKARGRYPP